MFSRAKQCRNSQPISRKTTGATPELLTVPRVSKHSDLRRRHSIFGCRIVKERRQAALGFELGHLLLRNSEVATLTRRAARSREEVLDLNSHLSVLKEKKSRPAAHLSLL
jgi:hypothetical protein